MRWKLAVLALMGLQLVISLSHAAQAEIIPDGDASAYYVVARNFARGMGLTDTMLCFFLGHPASVVHAAGDYWGPGWSLALGVMLHQVGTSELDAMLCCALLSTLLPLLVFANCRWLFPDKPVAAVLAALLVCLQNRLFLTNIVPDVTLAYTLANLAAIYLVLRALRSATWPSILLAGVALSVCLSLRGEGFIPILAALAGLAAGSSRSWRQKLRFAAILGAGTGLGMIPQFAYNLSAFGSLQPSARRLTLWLTDFSQLYGYDHQPSFQAWQSQGLAHIGQVAGTSLLINLGHLFTDPPWPLFIAALGTLALRKGQKEGMVAVAALIALTWMVPCLMVPYVAGPHRVVAHVIPWLCIVAAPLCAQLLESKYWPAGALLTLACIGLHWPLKFASDWPDWSEPGWTARPASLAVERLKSLNLKRGDIVLTTAPTITAALLDVSTMSCPSDGVLAVDHAIEAFHPKYLVIGFVPHDALEEYRQATGLTRFSMTPKLELAGTTWYEVAYPP